MTMQLSMLAGETRLGAQFSPCGVYRYRLWRRWAPGPSITWCMLNPSTADETRDDPTVRRCIGFSRAWGAGGLIVVNLFALRSTDPSALYDHPDPIGSGNDAAIREAALESSMVVAAWGVHGAHLGRGEAVRQLLGESALRCLGTTKEGHPRHPLYVRGDQPPVPYLGERKAS